MMQSVGREQGALLNNLLLQSRINGSSGATEPMDNGETRKPSSPLTGIKNGKLLLKWINSSRAVMIV